MLKKLTEKRYLKPYFSQTFSRLLLKFLERQFWKTHIVEYFCNFQFPVFIFSKLHVGYKKYKKLAH